MSPRRFARSRNSVVYGVCAGLAEYVGMDATLMRILWCIVAIATMLFPAVIGYLILMFVMEPPNGDSRSWAHRVDGRKLSLWFSCLLILFGVYLIATALLHVSTWFFIPVALIVAGVLLVISALRHGRR